MAKIGKEVAKIDQKAVKGGQTLPKTGQHFSDGRGCLILKNGSAKNLGRRLGEFADATQTFLWGKHSLQQGLES